MKELTIFVDEAGLLGPFKKNDPYYVLSFVFHNQELDISEELLHLEENFANLGFKAQFFHAGPTGQKTPKKWWVRPFLKKAA